MKKRGNLPDKSLLVERLADLHRFFRADLQVLRHSLLQLHRVQRQRLVLAFLPLVQPTRQLSSTLLHHHARLLLRDQSEQRDRHQLVEQSVPRPFQLHRRTSALTRMVDRSDRRCDQPERLGNEVLCINRRLLADLALQITFYHKAESGELTWTVGDRGGHIRGTVAEKEGLKASEDAADSKVDFLTRVGGFGLVLVRRSQSANRVPYIGRDEGGKVGA